MSRNEQQAAKVITAERILWRTAYPRNGNAHNPTRYYRWVGQIDGRAVTCPCRTKREALAVARNAAVEA